MAWLTTDKNAVVELPTMRELLIAKYLDYRNNYLTVEQFAIDNRININTATFIIEKGRYYFDLQQERETL